MALEGALADLAGAVAALGGQDLTVLPAGVVGDQLLALGQLLDQLEAERLRRLAVFDRAGGAAADGAVSTAAWLRERAGLAPGAARERVALARELADARPVTAAALAAGRIGYAAAKEIALGLRDAPACVPAEAADAVEPVLVEQAPALAPGDIRRLLTRTLHALAPDAVLAREEQVHDRRGVRLSPLGDGWVLSGDLTGECGAALDVALRALVAGQPPAVGDQPRSTLPQRRHDALHALARRLLDSGRLPGQTPDPDDDGALPGPPVGPGASVTAGADGEVPHQGPVPLRLPDTGGERPHLLVITDLAALQAPSTSLPSAPAGDAAPGPALLTPTRGRLEPDRLPPGLLVPAAELHGSGPVSHHLARRLGCDASLTRVIVDSAPARGLRADPAEAAVAVANPGAPPGRLDLAAVRALLPPALGGPVSQVLDVGRRSRTVPPATRRAVLARDRGCRWPRCARSSSEGEVHHLRHWADGGTTDLGNLLLLCWAHHRLLHEGGWTLRLRGDGTVELLRPDGTPVIDLAA